MSKFCLLLERYILCGPSQNHQRRCTIPEKERQLYNMSEIERQSRLEMNTATQYGDETNICQDAQPADDNGVVDEYVDDANHGVGQQGR